MPRPTIKRSPSAPSRLNVSSTSLSSSRSAANPPEISLPPVTFPVQFHQHLRTDHGEAKTEAPWMDSLRRYPMPENSIHRIRVDGDAEPTFFTEAYFGEDDAGDTEDVSFPEAKQGPSNKPGAKSIDKPEPKNRHDMAVKTMEQNLKMVEVASSPIWRDRKIQVAAPPKITAEDEMEKRMNDIAKHLEDVRRRHETFVPGLDTGGITSSSSTKKRGVNGLTPEEQRERFELLKFVRKIEPDLPPLVKSPVTEKEPPKDQTLVRWNCSGHALKLQESKQQRKVRWKRAEEMANQTRTVLEMKQFLQAEKMQRKKDLAIASENRGVSQEDIYHRQHISAMMIFMRAWAAAGFLARLRDERNLSCMNFEGRMDLVTHHEEEITKTMRSSVLLQEAENMKESLSDQLFLKYKDMLREVFERKTEMKKMRQKARAIHAGLQAWHVFGQIAVRMKFVQKAVHTIQQWWKFCQKKLKAALKKVDTLWQQVEHDYLVEQMKKENESRSKPFKKNETASYETRLQLRVIPEDVRITFIEHELRSRRFRFLPRLKSYDQECKKWRREMLEAQEALRRLKVSRRRPSTVNEGAEAEGDVQKSWIMLFRWPPVRGPSYLPGVEEARDMITRARANPVGWLPLPKVAGASHDEKKTGRARKSFAKTRNSTELGAVAKNLAASGDRKLRKCKTSPAGLGDISTPSLDSEEDTEEEKEAEEEEDEEDEEEPDFVDEELEALGCRPSMMPGGIARPPPSLPD
eukprot:TRINITY_DN14479_c0_g3_i1.p1 TRINITY_DN14479_c0_g3~~TRINITY_DN14479_c0_g3_i1.p1  ORF type:complete len:746 (-),score=156.52 TRINITY_DN14479_c0_g3_i1:117-2354(-)